MQIEVEKSVWSTIKRRSDDAMSDFKIFSIFNRFADPMKLPLEISPLGINFVLKNLGITAKKSKTTSSMNFDDFLVFINDHEFSLFKLDKLYDQVVLDVIQRGFVRGKITKNG